MWPRQFQVFRDFQIGPIAARPKPRKPDVTTNKIAERDHGMSVVDISISMSPD